MTDALERLQLMLNDVDNLIEHHPKTNAPGRGRPSSDEGPLLRSCVALTYAAWEVYVEDSMIEIAGVLSQRTAPSDLPTSFRDFIAAATAGDPWLLAGDGWRTIAVSSVVELVRGDATDATSFGINTAGPRQVNQLHEKLLGVRLLDRCAWRGMSNRRVKEELASLVTIRGTIVHTGKTPGALHLKGVRDWRNFTLRLGQALDAKLEDWHNGAVV